MARCAGGSEREASSLGIPRRYHNFLGKATGMIRIRQPRAVDAWLSSDFHVRNDNVHAGMFRQLHILTEAYLAVLNGALKCRERRSILPAMLSSSATVL
jgi:hypothetical protein